MLPCAIGIGVKTVALVFMRRRAATWTTPASTSSCLSFSAPAHQIVPSEAKVIHTYVSPPCQKDDMRANPEHEWPQSTKQAMRRV